MNLYNVLCAKCKRKADAWGGDKVTDRSEENWEKNYKPCDSCYAKVRTTIEEGDNQNPE